MQEGNMAIHRGAAPEPRKTAEAEFDSAFTPVDNPNPLNPNAQVQNMQVGVEAQGDLTELGSGQMNMQSSEPPAQPGIASELQEMKQKYGEAVNQLGKMKDEFALEMEEMKLGLELEKAEIATANQSQIDPTAFIPAGMDPNKLDENMKVRDFFSAMSFAMPLMQGQGSAQAIRAQWDVKPSEETAVLDKFPNIKNLQEPMQTMKIMDAVTLMRRRNGAQDAGGSPSSQGATGRDTTQRQITERVVPSAPGESAAASNMAQGGDLTPLNQVTQARQEYDQARRIKNPKERIEKMREATKKIQGLTGVSDQQVIGSSWASKS